MTDSEMAAEHPLAEVTVTDGKVKVELGLCKGKKLHDKRDSEAERESKRDIERTLKERNY